jgi:hypothetical protein
LRKVGKEDVWTKMQGYVYGPRMAKQQAFPGALSFFQKCRDTHTPVFIISHKTKAPYQGEAYESSCRCKKLDYYQRTRLDTLLLRDH